MMTYQKWDQGCTIHDGFYAHFCKTIVYAACDGSNRNGNLPKYKATGFQFQVQMYYV